LKHRTSIYSLPLQENYDKPVTQLIQTTRHLVSKNKPGQGILK